MALLWLSGYFPFSLSFTLLYCLGRGRGISKGYFTGEPIFGNLVPRAFSLKISRPFVAEMLNVRKMQLTLCRGYSRKFLIGVPREFLNPDVTKDEESENRYPNPKTYPLFKESEQRLVTHGIWLFVLQQIRLKRPFSTTFENNKNHTSLL